MTRQLDMMPGEFVSDSMLEHIDSLMPKPREVEPRLPLHACMHPVDAIKSVFASAGIQIHPELETRMRAICDEQVTVDEALDRHLRMDVGHELVLPERAREDHR